MGSSMFPLPHPMHLHTRLLSGYRNSAFMRLSAKAWPRFLANRTLRMTEERCASAPVLHFARRIRTSAKKYQGTDISVAPIQVPLLLPRGVCSFPPLLVLEGAPLFFLSTPISFPFFRCIAAIYGLLQEGREDREDREGRPDKSLVVRRENRTKGARGRLNPLPDEGCGPRENCATFSMLKFLKTDDDEDFPRPGSAGRGSISRGTRQRGSV